jgi:hypothetical protein
LKSLRIIVLVSNFVTIKLIFVPDGIGARVGVPGKNILIAGLIFLASRRFTGILRYY